MMDSIRKLFASECDPKEPLAWAEVALPFVAMLVVMAIVIVCGGCMSENTGSSTIVGEQLALPEISDSADSIAVRVYESIKGARVWTAKDSKVTVEYTNTCTNQYFGLVETRDAMTLKVKVEPLDVAGGEPEKAK